MVVGDGLLIELVALAVAGGTPVIFAATGELLLEKTGVYNIGLEGVMLIGALAGVIGATNAGSWVAGLLIAGIAGGLFALVFGVMTVILRTDMVVAGIALILIALGITGEVGVDYVREPVASTIPVWNVPLLSELPYVGPAIFQQPVTSYAAFGLPFCALFILSRTRHGLNVRALGENPDSADAAGVSVIGGRMFYVWIGGVLGGVGGGVLTLGIVQTWAVNVTNGEGWIAFAIVFFAAWRPLWILVGAYLFGALLTLGNIGQAEGWSIPSEVYAALPYAGTVMVMVVRAWLSRRRGDATPWPDALGLPFFRR